MKIEKYQFAAIISFLIFIIFPVINFLIYDKGTGINYSFIFVTYICFILSIGIGFINTVQIVKKHKLNWKQKILWIALSQTAMILIALFYLSKAIA